MVETFLLPLGPQLVEASGIGAGVSVLDVAAGTGREAEFDDALDHFCDEWNRGTAEQARFEKQYLLAVGTRA